MPWRGVTVSEQRQRFLEDYQLNYYSVTELAERFGISRTTAYKWINRFKKHGQAGFHEHTRASTSKQPLASLPSPTNIRLKSVAGANSIRILYVQVGVGQ